MDRQLRNLVLVSEPRTTALISITMKVSAPYVEVRVKDSGIGIDEAHIPHVFERFFKADASRNREKGGSGLGLSIVQKIVQLHNGTIEVTSTKGVGTAFIVELPLHEIMEGEVV
ncbi:sensor histidine kinase [Paenibacillus faecalis]|uniref:sensor histidine kinase n=1 Tax=Paenibacillus faecalis TaxID=2079532 RepID=UPI002351CD83|nr:ATP-binding protein [Paenibacillus faecalis]